MTLQINVLLAFMIIGSFLLAIMLHEWAHAQMAAWLGDSTPTQDGRRSLRLRQHLDPVGTLMCVILAFMPIAAGPLGVMIAGMPPAGIGWGKPVKLDPWRMRVKTNTGVLLVACAGPVFSLLLGLLCALIAGLLWPVISNVPNFFTLHLMQLIIVFAVTNICLAIFNLIPCYPLDGYQILYTLLPSKQAVQFARSAPYGPFIILALFFVLPFIARLVGAESFPLFRLGYYIWLGAQMLVSLGVSITEGSSASFIEVVQQFYFF